MIIPCPTCHVHEFQDAVYGINVRVCNQCGDGAAGKYRCTVCLAIIQIGKAEKAEKVTVK